MKRRNARYHPVVDNPGPVDRAEAWLEFARSHGETGTAFAMFALLARAHNWLRERGYLEDDMARVTPTERGHEVLTRADGYEKYRTGGKA